MTIMSTMAVLLACSTAVVAQTKGYALYGDVPAGYTDLTSNVQVVAPAVISGGQNMASTDHVAPSADGVAFTGRGHSNHYCQGSADLSIRFSENETLTLTENYAIHVKIKRTNAGSGDIQMSFIRNSWGSVRVGFLMDASKLSDTESEIVLKYADRKQNGGGQYYCNGENQTYGTRTFNGGNGTEIFRMTAANGEAFLITGLYLEATYEEPTPGPGPEPDPDPEFDAPVAVEGMGYLLYGATAPCGYDDLKSSVAYSAKGSLTLNDAAGLKITGAGLPGRICETGNYLQMSFSAQQSLTLDENFSLHVVIAKSSSATGDVQVSFCRNGWNSTRIAYTIANSAIGTEPTDIELKYTARNTGNWNSYGESAALGSPATFPAAEILRLCAAAGEEFTITGLYLQTSDTPCSAGDPTDTEAPAGLTASASEVSHNSLKLTMTATDDSEGQITYVVTYDTDKTKSVKVASGADAEVVIDGLNADTEYAFSIVAKDATGNTSAPVIVNQRTAKEPLGYALYGAVPTDFADLTDKVTITKNGNTNWEAPTFTGAGNPGIIANTGDYLNVALSDAQTFTLTEQFALHIRIKKVSGTNDVQVSLTSGDWNHCRAGWLIKNTKMSDAEYTDFALEYANTDVTMSYSCDSKQNLLGGKSFSGTVLRICAANGEQFDIDQIYLEKTYVKPADLTAPAGLTVSGVANKYNKVTFTFVATDENDEEITYMLSLNGGAAEEVHGASGVEQTKVYTDLSESTTYTLSVIAKDAAGNESAPQEAAVTTPAKGVIPAQTAQRIYLKKGTAITPDGVSEEVHTSYVVSQWYNCVPSEDFYGVTTAVREWWMNFQIQSDAAVDLSPVYGTWYLVVAFSSEVADMDRDYTFTLGAISATPGAPTITRTYPAAQAGQRVVWQMPLSRALSIEDADHLDAKAAGQVLLDMATGFNNAEGLRIEFDYIYFTNEPFVFTLDGNAEAADNSDLLAADGAKVDVQLQRSLIADGGLYTLCLPFALDADATQTYFPGAFSQLESSELRGDMIHLNFEPVEAIEAGVPYLYCPTSDVVNPLITDVRIDATASTTVSTTYFDMVGVYSPAAMPEGTYFLGTGNYLYQINPADAGLLRASRAYFVIRDGAPAGVRARVVMTPHTTTDMQSADADTLVTKCLINGQIGIQRDGRIYNMMGQLMMNYD